VACRVALGQGAKNGRMSRLAKTFSIQFTPFSNVRGESQKKSKKSEIYEYLRLQ
jgi:hypothetical protein